MLTSHPSTSGEVQPPGAVPPAESPVVSAGRDSFATARGYPLTPTGPALPPAPPGGFTPPAAEAVSPTPPREPRSPLGRLVFSIMVLALGVVIVADVGGAHVPASAYFAVPLAVVGAGLVVAAWYGRARALIALGILLSLGLAIIAGVEGANMTASRRSVTWRPVTVEQLDRTYQISAGNAVLDLSTMNFVDRSAAVDVRVSVGNLEVVLPSNVDVQVRADVGIGDATVFGEHWSGINQSPHDVTDNGSDGPGGGSLVLNASVNVGNLEVRR